MTRPRACAALIRNKTILMVRHDEPARTYWTLPGGGIEPGETPAEAAVREVREETGLSVRAVRLLWEGFYGHGGRTNPEFCYLAETDTLDEDTAILGHDPEEAHLPAGSLLLQGVAWVPLDDLAGDAQIERVRLALASEMGMA